MTVPRPVFPEGLNTLDRPSPELRALALKTLPFEPVFSRVVFELTDDKGDAVYPAVTDRWAYNPRQKSFEPTYHNPGGEIPTRIEVSTRGEGFDYFKKVLLPTLLHEHYIVEEADLARTVAHLKDKAGGVLGVTYMNEGIVISPWSINVRYGVYRNESRSELTEFFHKLQQSSRG